MRGMPPLCSVAAVVQRRFGTIPVVCALAIAAPCWAQSITAIPLLPGRTTNDCECISPDGETIGGVCPVPTPAAFTWSVPTGTVNIGNPTGGNISLTGMSTLGQAISLTMQTGPTYQAFRWTPGGGYQDLVGFGTNLTFATGISRDGTVVSGYATPQNDNIYAYQAYRWTTSGGFQGLGPYGGIGTTISSGVSGDGSTILGGVIFFGPWAGLTWKPGIGYQSIGVVNADATMCSASSYNGAVIAGYQFNASEGFYWTSGTGMQLLSASSPTQYNSFRPVGMTTEGIAVVVNMSSSLPPYGDNAGVWTPGLGMTDLPTLLAAEGVNLAGWQITRVAGVSADGKRLAGTGFYQGVKRGWYVSGIRPICGPRVSLLPSNVSACSGGTASFSTLAASPVVGQSVQYQWARYYVVEGEPSIVPLTNGVKQNGQVVSGATSPNLTIQFPNGTDAGQYVCQVTAGCATVTLGPATLTIVPQPPGITGTPASTSKCTGTTVSFSASATPPSAAPFTVVWNKGGVPINLNNPRFTVTNGLNGMTSTLQITNIQMSDQTTQAGGYVCGFFNACGGAPAGPATLGVIPDFDNNGGVGTAELAAVLNNFGQNVAPYTNGDLNGDGAVNSLDLGLVLGLFGTACPP